MRQCTMAFRQFMDTNVPTNACFVLSHKGAARTPDNDEQKI